MKLPKSTVLLFIAALALGGITLIVVANQEQTQQIETEQRDLFRFSEEQVTSLLIQTPDQVIRFERTDAGWQMIDPDTAPASEASIAFLLNLLTSEQSERQISVPTADLTDFGFDTPQAIIDVTLENGTTHKLVVGGYDFSQSFLYAQVDPPANALAEAAEANSEAASETLDESADETADENTDETDSESPIAPSTADLEVQLVSPTFADAINRPLEQWKQTESPIDASPTPEASPPIDLSPTEESPAIDASPTPEDSPAIETAPPPESSPPESPSPEASP